MSVSAKSYRGKRQRRRIIGVCVALALLVLVALLGLLYYLNQTTTQAQLNAASAYCGALKAQRYADAYHLLSASYRASVSQTQFSTQGAEHDVIDGPVVACSRPTLANGTFIALGSDSATVALRITRRHSYSGALSLTSQNGAWTVSAISTPLQGTDLQPLDTATVFCAALVSGHPADAYADLSSAYQQTFGSEAAFATAFSFPNATITGCAPNLGSYQTYGISASLNETLNVRVSANGASRTVALPTMIALTQENGQWKVSSFTLQTP